MDERRPLNDPASSSDLQELRADVRAKFAEVHAEFADVHAEFAEVHAELAEVHAELAELRAEFGALEVRLVDRIVQEGETTRRHFNIMVERVNETVKVVAEGVGHHTTVLDDHERRIKTLERRRRP